MAGRAGDIGGYVLRKVLGSAAMVLGVVLLTFVLFSVVGGNVAGEIAGQGAGAETIEEVRSQSGLDKPLFFAWDSQFVRHVVGDLTFDFGRARDGEAVLAKIRRGAGPSLLLTAPILLGVVIGGVAIGLLLAFVRGSTLDRVGLWLCVAGMSVPYLGYILFGQYLVAYKWGWLPVYYSPEEGLLRCLVLPVGIAIAAGLGGHVRFYRSVALEELGKDYVRTAYAKGLGPWAVMSRHVLRNVLIVVVSRVAAAIPFLFLGSVLLERFFGINGQGYLMVEAVGSRDFAVINAMTYITALLVVGFNLVADICYGLIDPRVRVAGGQ